MLKLYSILVRKAIDYNHLLEDQKTLVCRFHTHPEEFKINTIIEISHEEFELFKSNMLDDYDFIKGVNEVFLVKEKGTEDMSGIIVDAQGSTYARHVGIPMQKCEIMKCPICSKYFAEPPAISRKDNKTYICSKCGQKEALELFKDYISTEEYKQFIEIAQKNANLFNAQIVISIPNNSDIIIQSKK